MAEINRIKIVIVEKSQISGWRIKLAKIKVPFQNGVPTLPNPHWNFI